MEKDRLRYLFTRYLERKCSPDEIRDLLIYFRQEEETSELRALVESELSAPVSAELETPGLKSMFSRVENRLDMHINQDQDNEIRPVPFYKSYLLRLTVAASFVGLLLVATFYREAIVNLFYPVHFYELVTSSSQHKEIKLADGTKIWLSPNSRLSYPDKFNGQSREVQISGQAFFEVQHDINHPFIVHSGKLQTKVLGTTFNVSAYKTDDNIEVTLLSGKVRVSLNRENIDISPNQRVVYSAESGKLIKENDFDAGRFLGQKLGVLDYKGTPLHTVIKDMEREFQISIDLDSRLSNCLFIGSFKSSDSPQVAIQQVVLSFNARFKQVTPGSYIITGQACR